MNASPAILTTILPATACEVVSAKLQLLDERYWLRLEMRARGRCIIDAIQGVALTDLLYELVTRLGFDLPAAQRLLGMARMHHG